MTREELEQMKEEILEVKKLYPDEAVLSKLTDFIENSLQDESLVDSPKHETLLAQFDELIERKVAPIVKRLEELKV